MIDNKFIIESGVIESGVIEQNITPNPRQLYITDLELSKPSLIEFFIKYSHRLFYIILCCLLVTGSFLIWITFEYNTYHDKLFWINQGLKYLVINIIQYLGSLGVKYYDIKVNYTRKLVHISYFIWPQILDKILIKYHKNIYSEIWNIYIILILLFMISEPFRNKCNILKTLFLSVDRPEDRPYTLIWFSTQIIATLIIFIPFVVYFNSINKNDILFIPILINGLGDGLAEPIGIRFGKHKYKTTSFLSSREYTRSYEGSLCVYLVSLITVLSYYNYFSIYQYIFCSITIPIVSTITEAYSPHTWDSPLIYLSVLICLTISIYI